MVNPQSRFSCARDTKGEGQCRGLLLSADASWRTATLKTPYATQARLHAVALTAAFACQGDKRLNDGSTQMGQAAGDHAMHASALRLGQSYSQRAYLRGEVRKDGLICRGHKTTKTELQCQSRTDVSLVVRTSPTIYCPKVWVPCSTWR